MSKVLKVKLVLPVRPGHKDLLARRAMSDLKEQRVPRGQQEMMVRLAQRGRLVKPGRPGHKDHKVQQGRKVCKDLPVQPE